jgi:hypothetical protein
VAEDLFDAIFIGITEEQTSGLSPNLAEALAAYPDSRRVDDRKHLFDMAQQQRVEQSFVRILQVAEKAVFIEGARLFRQRLHSAFNLLIQIAYMRRRQAMQVKDVAFMVGEGCSLIEAGGIDQVKSRKSNLPGLFAVRLPQWLLHYCPSSLRAYRLVFCGFPRDASEAMVYSILRGVAGCVLGGSEDSEALNGTPLPSASVA